MIVTRELEQAQSVQADGQQREEEARHLLTSDPDELVRRYLLVCSLLEDERAARDAAEQDSQQVREENGELLEELTAERQAHEQTRQMLATEQRRYKELDSRHTTLSMKWEGRQKWREELLANETIPNPSCKLVGTYLWENGLENTDGELQFFKERIAADLGCDRGTVSSAIERMKSFDVINVRTEDVILADGTKHKNALTYISRNTLVDPTSIVMEKKQGAAKPNFCFRDGTTPMDAYTVRHCRTHGEIGLYDQPGHPKNPDDTLMIDDFIKKYQHRVPHALSDYRDPVTGFLIDTTGATNETRTSEEKKPSSTATTSTASNNADNNNPQRRLHNNTNTSKSGNTEEKKPSSTAIAPTTSEPAYISPEVEQRSKRYNTAVQIFIDLENYGLALDYREDGRHLVPLATRSTTPSSAQLQSLTKRIKQYDPEVRKYLKEQADYDPQLAIQLFNATLSEQQLSTQRISTPSAESFEEGSHG